MRSPVILSLFTKKLYTWRKCDKPSRTHEPVAMTMPAIQLVMIVSLPLVASPWILNADREFT